MAALQVSVPIGHELLGQCIKQGQALVQRASLVGDFSDYESWKAARKQWIDPTVQALEHMYGSRREAREFADAVTCPDGSKRWQEQYAADLRCVEEAINLLTVLQGELAFSDGRPAAGAGELTAGAPEPQVGPAEPVTDAGEPGDTGEPPVAEPSPRAHDEQRALDPQSPSGRPFAEPSAREPEPPTHQHAVGAELAPAQAVGSQLAHHSNGAAPAERDPAAAGAPAPARTRQVLVAHGRDERWKQAVEHLLEQAGEHEIRIVSQRSGERSRLSEAIGEEAPASRYAVVLLTADDIGGPRLESDSEPYFSTRAHQEVVFQMGFLVAALSPGRVCVLYEDGVELPYDLEGVSHVRLDLAGTWQPKLLLHLRRAGFDYDMNKLVQV
ncbi:MAG: TIR domain-containing protein [Solirubrobacterales bacterium]